jgi:hypothetical protein
MHDEKELRQFDRWGKERPSHEPHGTAEEIRANLKQAVASSWRMEGNQLIAETQYGPLVQSVPTDVICRGMDDQGLPILVKLTFE